MIALKPESVTDTLHIGEATTDQIPQLCELLGELFDQESDFMPDQFKQAAGLRLVIENPDCGRIFVGRQGTLVVGMINLLIIPSARQGGMGLLFEDLIVKSDFRGQGIATRLLKHAFEFACKIGAVQATLLTDDFNEPAAHLYRKMGFSQSGLSPMRMSLPG